jgi:LemA protein
MLWLWIALGVVAILLVLVGIGYNRLVRLRNEAATGWANIDVQLERRGDLIPNLVETVKGYAAHERGVFDEVTRARTALQQASTPAAAGEANDVLTAALGRLFAVAEAYPELRASENFLRLQDELTDTEDKISAARRYYNSTVMHYNTGIQSLPVGARRPATRLPEKEFFSAEGRHGDAAGLVHARDVTLQQQIRRNRLRSGIVVVGFVLLLGIVAGLIGAVFDLSLGVVALLGAGLYAIFSIISSRRIVARMTGAQELGADQLRPLRRLVENVSIAAGLPVTPEVRIVDDPAPNAFAAGLRPQTSYLGVTTGLLRVMPKRELEAVLGHEISHVRNRDTYLMTMATIFAGVIALIADIGFRMLLYGGGRSRKGRCDRDRPRRRRAPARARTAALLLKLSLSRRREFLADAGSAEILNDPEAMALALRRLELDTTTGAYATRPSRISGSRAPRAASSPIGAACWRFEPLRHASAARGAIAALEESGGFRLPERLPDHQPFAGRVGLQ